MRTPATDAVVVVTEISDGGLSGEMVPAAHARKLERLLRSVVKSVTEWGAFSEIADAKVLKEIKDALAQRT